MEKLTLFWDMDGTVAKWNPMATVEDLFSEGYFLNREAEEDLCNIAELFSKKFESYILTACMAGSDYLIPEKKLWIERFIPGLSKRILFVPCGVSKSQFVSDVFHRDLSNMDMLIDDHSPNLLQWQDDGGTGIKWCNAINNSKKSTYKGMRCKTARELESMILWRRPSIS